MRSAGEVRVLGVDPAHGDEAWRARLGVVLQSWRDHGKWRVRELLDTPRALLRAVHHAASATAVGRRRADRHGRADRARRQAGRPALRRAAAPARRGHRHRRQAGAAVPGRADGRLRPARPARVPRPRAPAVRPGGHHDPADHARSGRGREAGRPDPHPGRRADHRRRLRRRAVPADVHRGRGALDARRRALRALHGGRHPVRARAVRGSTARRSPTSRCAGPAWRTPTWPWCSEFESGQRERRRARSRRWPDEPHDGRRPGRGSARRIELRQTFTNAQDLWNYLFLGRAPAGRHVLHARRHGARHRLLARRARRCPACSA